MPMTIVHLTQKSKAEGYHNALHDILNHLRDQPKDSTGYDMLMAVQQFTAELDLENNYCIVKIVVA